MRLLCKQDCSPQPVRAIPARRFPQQYLRLQPRDPCGQWQQERGTGETKKGWKPHSLVGSNHLGNWSQELAGTRETWRGVETGSVDLELSVQVSRIAAEGVHQTAPAREAFVCEGDSEWPPDQTPLDLTSSCVFSQASLQHPLQSPSRQRVVSGHHLGKEKRTWERKWERKKEKVQYLAALLGLHRHMSFHIPASCICGRAAGYHSLTLQACSECRRPWFEIVCGLSWASSQERPWGHWRTKEHKEGQMKGMARGVRRARC